jgi:hypothetical protein
MNISDFAHIAFQAGYLALSPDSGTVLAAAWMRGYKRRCDEDAVNG